MSNELPESFSWKEEDQAKASSLQQQNKQKRKLPLPLSYILGALGIMGILLWAFRPSPILVEVAQVKRGDLEVTVNEEGETRIRKRYTISAPVEGRLARINLDEGDTVVKGQIIAQIDPLALQSQIEEAQARLRQWEAEKLGVETQRPKTEAISQAQERIRGLVAKKRETMAKIEQAKASLEQAKRDRQRNQFLHEEGAISRQQKERAELEEISKMRALEAEQRAADSIDAEINAAQEALSILQAEQQDPDYLLDVYDARIAEVKAELVKLTDDANLTQITSPINGYVLRILLESAKYVEAGAQLLELGDPQDLEIVVDLLSSDAVKVKPGATMFLEHWGGESTLKAKVRYIEPSAFTKVSALGVEEQRVNIIADFLDTNVPLGDRYRVETRTVVWSGEDVLVIPSSGLFRCDQENDQLLSKKSQGRLTQLWLQIKKYLFNQDLRETDRVVSSNWCTFVVENNKAQKRKIKVSQSSDSEAVIEDGLQVGEKVILHANEQIQSGIKVKISE